MSFTEKMVFISVIVLSVQSTRLSPLLLPEKLKSFFKNEELNERINRGIFFFLILYCYRDFSLSPEYLLRVGCGVCVFIIQYFTGRTLFSVFFMTALYMGFRYYLIGV